MQTYTRFWVALLIITVTRGFRRPLRSPPSSFSPTSSRRLMFSGIVEEIGECASFVQCVSVQMWDGSVSEGAELTVRLREGSSVLCDSYIGCSIAVNGVCLTATKIDQQRREFTAGLAPETIRRSNLGMLTSGSAVNLERALKADGRNSGHFVQ